MRRWSIYIYLFIIFFMGRKPNILIIFIKNTMLWRLQFSSIFKNLLYDFYRFSYNSIIHYEILRLENA